MQHEVVQLTFYLQAPSGFINMQRKYKSRLMVIFAYYRWSSNTSMITEEWPLYNTHASRNFEPLVQQPHFLILPIVAVLP